MKTCNVFDPASLEGQEIHPLGSDAKVLLTGIFGPFALDDEYGSRKINPAEFHHNQITRVQGPFSLRMFHRNGGLKLIQANINAPCTLLEYPDLDRFTLELQNKQYDIIGISAIQPNLKKVEKMCALIREHQPNTTIVIGGHIAIIADLDARIDADYVVRGDGVRWFRKFLGEDQDGPINHPHIPSGINRRCMGINLSNSNGDRTAVLMPSAGCPVGCNFCSTSAMFGGKGKFVSFYKTGDELFDIMCQLEEQMGVCSFFVMDENFLFYRTRTLRLLELMQTHEKDWALHIFASADVLTSYTIEQLVGLGISWVWIGLEGKSNHYKKLKGIDTHALVRKLQANGIRILGSTIIGLEEHTPQNIDEEIEWSVSHATEFHQFMLYTAPQGTPLYEQLKKKGMLLDESEIEPADVHGQFRFNYHHPHIDPGQENDFLLRAFRRDFEMNGPSVMRVARTVMNGWVKYRHHPEARIRKRYARDIEKMPTMYAGSLWATRRWFKDNSRLVARMTNTLDAIYHEFGFRSRIAAPVVGLAVLFFLRKEEKRLATNYPYEPPTFYETSVMAFRPRDKTMLPSEADLSPATPAP